MVTKKQCKCGRIFYIHKSDILRGCGKYCSRECYYKYGHSTLGQKRTKEQRKRMSIAHKGIPSPNKGKTGYIISYRKGRTWEEIWGKKEAKKMKENLSRKKWTGNWHKNQGGYLRRVNRKTKKEILYHQHIWMKANNKRKIPKGFLIHHKDKNILNNDIKNLQLMSFSEHTRNHHIGMKHSLESRKKMKLSHAKRRLELRRKN